MRYRALWAYRQVLESGHASRAGQGKRWSQVQRVGQQFADASNLMGPLLVHTCLELPGGFIAGALQTQVTSEVFFPLHLASRRVWWHLCYLSDLPPSAVKRSAALCSVGGNSASAHSQVGWRCAVCGLLKAKPAEYLEHARHCHLLPDGNPRHASQGAALLAPEQVLRRPESLKASPWVLPCAVLTEVSDALEHACSGLALREATTVISIWDMRSLWRLLMSLIPYVVFQCGAAGPRLHHCPSVFDCCRFFITVFGRQAMESSRQMVVILLELYCHGALERVQC